MSELITTFTSPASIQNVVKEPLLAEGASTSSTSWAPSDSSQKQSLTVQLEDSLKVQLPSYIVDAATSNITEQQDAAAAVSRRKFYGLLRKSIHEKDLSLGRDVYTKVKQSGLLSDSFLGSHLIRMFTVFGHLTQANEIFNTLAEPSAFAWSAIISAHAKLSDSKTALELYFKLQASALEADGHIFVAALQACANSPSPIEGMVVHSHIIEAGLESQIYVGNALIDMYGKSGLLQDVYVMFNRLPRHDFVSWNTIIVSYCQRRFMDEVFQLFAEMAESGFLSNTVSFVSCLKACSNSHMMEQGQEIHSYLVCHGFDSDAKIGIALVEMYLRCGSIFDAKSVFKVTVHGAELCEKIIMAFFQHGFDQEVVDIFKSVLHKGIFPTVKTHVTVLRACSSIPDLNQGWEIHSQIIECGLEFETSIGNTLVSLYGKCRIVKDAEVVFNRILDRDLVTWTAIISGFSMNEWRESAIQAFHYMLKEGFMPNEITFASVLKACYGEAALPDGWWIHKLLVESGFQLDIFVGSALVDMYMNCGSLDDAFAVVQSLPEADIVTWSALITGYADRGYAVEALSCYKQIQMTCMEPSSSTFLAGLKACSSVSALEQGKQIHRQIVYRGLDIDAHVGTALLNMYAKCGALADGTSVFKILPVRDVVTWNTLIECFSLHNDYVSAVQSFHDMQKDCIQPNAITFKNLLTACSHDRRIDEGCEHFKSMRREYGLTPTLEQYYILVEMLGNVAWFDEAEDLMDTVPFQSNVVGWMSLLTSCVQHGNVELGRQCFNRTVQMKPGYSSAYALMWNLYTVAGLLDDAKEVEDLRIGANAWKKPAKAFIEVDNQVHSFAVADKTHPQSAMIYEKLKSLIELIKTGGYSPQVNLIPDYRSDLHKENALCEHPEKLGIVFGLISAPKGSTIRVSKNLRICADCHSAARAISKVEMRDIVIIDAYQVHHFKDGACSCLNDW